jgi:hypothetical protein
MKLGDRCQMRWPIESRALEGGLTAPPVSKKDAAQPSIPDHLSDNERRDSAQ